MVLRQRNGKCLGWKMHQWLCSDYYIMLYIEVSHCTPQNKCNYYVLWRVLFWEWPPSSSIVHLWLLGRDSQGQALWLLMLPHGRSGEGHWTLTWVLRSARVHRLWKFKGKSDSSMQLWGSCHPCWDDIPSGEDVLGLLTLCNYRQPNELIGSSAGLRWNLTLV